MASQKHLIRLRFREDHRCGAQALVTLIRWDVFEPDTTILYEGHQGHPRLVDPPIGRGRVCRLLQASRTGHLGSYKQQVMLRVAHENIQFDAHEITLFKTGPPQAADPSPIRVVRSLKPQPSDRPQPHYQPRTGRN